MVTQALGNTALLSLWPIDKPDVVIEVQKKQRGGKNLKTPGNGFHKTKRGKTYAMSIAGTIAHDTVFSKARQYCTVVTDNQRMETLLGYMEVTGKDAVVLCAGGTQSLRHRLLLHGAVPDGQAWLKVGARRLALVAEVVTEAPALLDVGTWMTQRMTQHDDSTDDLDGDSQDSEDEHRGKGKGKGRGKGQGKGRGKGQGMGPGEAAIEGDEQQLYTVDVPSDVGGTELIVVYDGAVQECASLAKVIWSVHCPNIDLEVLHLASYERSVFVETHEARREIESQLGEDLRLCGELKFPGQQSVPRAAKFVPTSSSSEAHSTLLDVELPAVLDFRLRMASLGLVMRLRQRFGCSIPEVFYDPLCAILKSRHVRGK